MKNSYTAFANKYDLAMFDTDYAGWANFIIGIFEEHGINKNAKILETACGTGNISFFINRAGYDLTATDSSEEMLNMAVEKCRKNGQKINFAIAHMARLKFDSHFGAVICCCDGVNYLDKSQVKRFFAGAYDSLKLNGIIIFDISTEYKLKNTLADNIFCDETEDFAYIWKNDFDGEKCKMELTVFSKMEGDIFIRTGEYHELFAYSEDFISNEMKNAGFSDIAIKAGDNTPITEGRVLFIGRKDKAK